jgi:hypothetical protein
MKSIRDVSAFGAIAAEDDNLQKYFVKTFVFDDVLTGVKQVVVGRKGSGKTALYLALLERSRSLGHFSVGLTFQDYPWALHYKYASDVTDRYERFLASWKFLIFIELFKIILTDAERDARYILQPQKDALAAVEKFIKNNWGVIAFDYKKTFPSGGFALGAGDIKPSAAGFSLGGVSITRDGAKLGDTLSRLNEWLWHLLSVIGTDSPSAYIVFDELDAGFKSDSEDYVDRVTGLLLVVRQLTKEFAAIKLPFKVVAFLRSDIYDALHFGDKNKLTEANVSFLQWNDDLEYHGCSLKELIDHRIREELQLGLDVSDPWSVAFDPQVMRGTQPKFKHITFRSHLRPRDVIKFCNCALDEAKKRLRSRSRGGGPELITNDDIREARESYSQYMLAELDDEIAKSYTNWQRYLAILRKIGSTRFDRAQFAGAYAQVKPQLALELAEEEVLYMLYKYSIIAFERAAGKKGAYYDHFRFMDETVRLDPEARSFLVHRALKEALALSELNRQGGPDSAEDDGA